MVCGTEQETGCALGVVGRRRQILHIFITKCPSVMPKLTAIKGVRIEL
jgi:hypothetical protein